MPKKSKKSKSKRMTLRHKYKVIKKVKEHHKKIAKAAKKTGNKPKIAKDPGIPASWPFKEELLKDLEFQKQRILAQEQAKKDAKKARKELARAQGDEEMEDDAAPEGLSMHDVRANAARKEQQFEAIGPAVTGPAAGPPEKENSRRSFYKEFVKVVEAADVIIQVLDARDPLGCRCEEVERFIRRAGASKKIILLLNKIDLVPREVAEKWLKYLREELPTVAFKCSTQKQSMHLGRRRLPTAKAGETAASTSGGGECLGAENLLQLLKNYARNRDIKTAITVGIVGMPNVGKSSLINSLKRARVAAVGNTPGVTRTVQEVSLDKQVKLLDSPGIVMAGGSAHALRNAIKVEQLEDPVTPVTEVVARVPQKQLMATYKIGAFKGPEDFLAQVATVRGKLKKGGALDIESAARAVLQDWNDGRIRFFTLPPTRATATAEQASAEVVSSWGREFNADEVFANEARSLIEGLPEMDGATFFETRSQGAAAVGLEAMEEEEEQGPSGGASDEDELEDMDEADVGPSTSAGKTGRSGQNEALYVEEGQFNPHAARAEKKKKKKQAKAVTADEDYDFEEGFGDDGAVSDGGDDLMTIEDE